MDNSKITRALASATDTQALVIEPNSIDRVPELFKRYFSGSEPVIVADENTFAAAGKFLAAALKPSGLTAVEPLVFPGRPKLSADYDRVATVRDFLKSNGATAIAVGSGTINDIVKLASSENDRRYMAVATAASVDGYAAFGASVFKDGFKQTINCPAPLVIIADSNVLKKAPSKMTAAGYADLAGKFTAGSDWIIADAAGVEPIQPEIWNMVQTELGEWTKHPTRLAGGDSASFAGLFEGLTLSGLAMQAYQNTRPASGTEHLFSHLWEMQHILADGAPVSHGFKVSIGCIAATAMMETVLAKNLDRDEIEKAVGNWPDLKKREQFVRAAFAGTPMENGVAAACRSKHAPPDIVRSRLEKVASHWIELRSKVAGQLPPYPEMAKKLADAGCPVLPEQIGLTRRKVCDAYSLAQMIRPRYTILDLAFELGWLSDCIDAIFSSQRYLG